MKKLLTLIIILFSLSTTALSAQSVSFTEPSPVFSIAGDGDHYIPLTISIPDTGYIYSNPKGPGTGKAISFSLDGLSEPVAELYISEPEKYSSPLSDDWVWIHKKEAIILIPVTGAIDQKREISVSFSALFCDDTNCTPVGDNTTFILNPGMTNSSAILSSLPDSFNRVELSETSPQDKASLTTSFESLNFSPVYLDNNSIGSLVPALLTAFLAGLILNIMPCVLPVISIKIMSLVKIHTENRREMIIHGFAYFLGVMASFLVLASLAAFAGANWGALFQSKTFIIVMTVIIFSLALSMLGVYTLQAPGFINSLSPSSSVITGSFLNGLIATVLATPCSGPFLGATLAWTLTQPPTTIFMVFIFLGAGLAFPFLLLSFFPSLVNKIPRGGRWSLVIERALGFTLIASVIYFLSTLDKENIIFTMVILGFISSGLMIMGKLNIPSSSEGMRKFSKIYLVFSITAGIVTAQLINGNDTQSFQQKPFSYSALTSSLQQGSLVFVQFTADWCPNCSYLESRVLHTDEFNRLLEKNGIVYMKADLTEKGTEGEDFLNKLGSRSIPYGAFFYPGELKRPIALRDMFTFDDAVKAVNMVLESAEEPEDQPLLEPLLLE